MNGENAHRRRTAAFAALFWSIAVAFVAADWNLSHAHNRFDEPAPWQLGQEPGAEAGHCAAPLK